MKLLVEQTKSKKEEAKQDKPKIQEVTTTTTAGSPKTPPKLEEPEEEKVKPQQPKKMKNLQQEVIDKAAEIATQKTSANLSVPKTAAGLETDYNSMKKDLSNFYPYLKVCISKSLIVLEYTHSGDWNPV